MTSSRMPRLALICAALILPSALWAQGATGPQIVGAEQAAPPEAAAETAERAPPKVDPEQSARDGAEGGTMLRELLAAIAAERDALQNRSKALDMREAELAFAASALSAQERQLTALKGEIDRLLTLAESNHTADVARLVKIYRAMKPAEAASILSDADLEVSVLVLAAMIERDSGPIMAKMNPVRAQAISKIILERARLPGDQRLVNLRVD